jgi:hypothetical protein
MIFGAFAGMILAGAILHNANHRSEEHGRVVVAAFGLTLALIGLGSLLGLIINLEMLR